MSKHTETEWRAGPVFGKEGRAIFVTDESKPGKWQRRVDDKSGVFTESDAKLIAAAPRLLNALQVIAKDPKISEWLIANDPQAATQIGAAILAATTA